MSLLDDPVLGLFGTDHTEPANAHLAMNSTLHSENGFVSGNNDVSVMTVQLPNVPSTRPAAMNYSPAPSPTHTFSATYHPPSNPSFEPRDPHNTVLGQYASPPVD
jgi:hypothetical protein